MSSVSAYLELARWRNCLIAAAGVFVGAWWAGWGHPVRVIFAALAAICFTVGANAMNDAFDRAIDQRVHPSRPLPSGRVDPLVALKIGIGGGVLGSLLSAFVNSWLALVSCAVYWLILEYNARSKANGLPGNIIVAALASLPFLYGAWAVGNPTAGLVLVAIAAPMHFAREIAKDIDDVPGDTGHRRTVPIRWGLPVARTLIVVALVAFAVQIIPVARALPRLEWLILPALLLTAIGASRSIRGLPGAPRALKAAMLCTMLAFVIARI